MALTDQQLYDRLVRQGVMPAIAERIIANAAAANQELPTQAEVDEDSKITPADLELAAQWWLYTPAVVRKYKRLLHAKAKR